MFAVGYGGNYDATCTLYRIDRDSTLLDQRPIDLLGPRALHDIAITEQHVVVWDLPLEYADDDPGLFPYAWNREGAARVGLIDRGDLSGPVRWYDIDPCFVFHGLNAYDTDDGVVLDVVQFHRIFDLDRTGPGDPYPPQLWRWELDASASTARQILVDDRIQEFPRIDDRRTGRPYRYGYTIELMSTNGTQSLVAHDTSGGETQSWSTAAKRSLSEAIFVPESEAAGENEGWLLAIDSDREAELQRIEKMIDERHQRPINVPLKAIYSRNDGIVDWRTCPDRDTAGAVNVEVSSSHISMGIDPTVWMHLARWLAA